MPRQIYETRNKQWAAERRSREQEYEVGEFAVRLCDVSEMDAAADSTAKSIDDALRENQEMMAELFPDEEPGEN